MSSCTPLTQQQRSQQVSKATVVHLVKSSSGEGQQPPPLPPRPSGGLPSFSTTLPPVTEPKPQNHIIKHASSSLPRNHIQKRSKKQLSSTDASVKRQSFHDVSNSTLSMFTKPILVEPQKSTEVKPKVKQKFVVSRVWIMCLLFRNKSPNFAHYQEAEQEGSSTAFKQWHSKKEQGTKVSVSQLLEEKTAPKVLWAFM